ncbi:MAG: hypothetical protein AAF066_17765 [Pseudomonadota bacterium]
MQGILRIVRIIAKDVLDLRQIVPVELRAMPVLALDHPGRDFPKRTRFSLHRGFLRPKINGEGDL